MLRLNGIRKSYKVGPAEIEILKGIDLNLEKGDFLALTGTSGSGKTTLMNIIGLLDRPSSGEYAVDGEKVLYENDDSISELRNRKIGFIFQHYNLLPHLTVLDNVGVPLRYRGCDAGEIKHISQDLLNRLGLQELASRMPSELSGGQQQRAALARALVGSPALLLADEPTGALDTAAENAVMDLFSELHRDGLTIVLITHNPAMAARSKRHLVLRDGMIGDI